jgi:cold shock protein
MNKISGNLLKVSIISGLVLPFVLGGLFAAFGISPEFGFNQGGGLFRLFTSGSGWLVYLLSAALFFVAGLLPALAGNSVDSNYAGYEEESGDFDDREEGEVKWFNPNKGYGFITRNNGEEIFAHFRSIRGRGHRTLRQGQKVRFKAVEGDKGLQAEDISPC